MHCRSSIIIVAFLLKSFLTCSVAMGQETPEDRLVHGLPPGTETETKPRSMIVMSNDHNWFTKAYTDWANIDDVDGIDSTYKSTIDYYGYFDTHGCYDYDVELSGGAFKRVGVAANDHSCTEGDNWSGNLLNWASMTRIDVIRKALYGGKRYRDVANKSAILERAFLPMDKHSFSKIVSDSTTISDNTPLTASHLTFCNTTYHPKSGFSKDVNDPPLIRVAEGDERDGDNVEKADKIGWPRWANTDTWQCTWRGEDDRVGSEDAPYEGQSWTHEYKARVEVCAGADNDEVAAGCRNYGGAYAKPIGLLHDYANDIDFGLVTGSYQNNKRGGVLRANFENFQDEVSDSGVFKYHDVNLEINQQQAAQGIVSNLDALRIARYPYASGFYDYGDEQGDHCPYGRTSPFPNGECSNWGNPFAEIALEALRYVIGEDAYEEFSVGMGNVEDNFVHGLSSPQWNNDIEEKWCAVNSLLLVNGSEISYDNDQFSISGSSITESSIRDKTKEISTKEGFSGDYFVGHAESSQGAADDKYCTAKSLGDFSKVEGLCPTAPSLEGSFNVAGISRLAYDEPLIADSTGKAEEKIETYAVQLASNMPIITVSNNGDENKNENGNNKDKNVSIIPACVNVNRDATPPSIKGRCAMVDFKVEEDTNEKGGVMTVTWEDSEAGGDYDMDVQMEITYRIFGKRLDITTRTLNAAASETMGLGYILSGTDGIYGVGNQSNKIVVADSDGFNVHSGINGYWNNAPEARCTHTAPCSQWEPTSASYLIGGEGQGKTLKSPLYYAAKYGNKKGEEAYFEVSRIAELADQLSELLDSVLANERTGSAGAVGNNGSVRNDLFQTFYSYDEDDGWSGDVARLEVDSAGNFSRKWTASNQLGRDRLLAFFSETDRQSRTLNQANLLAEGVLEKNEIDDLLSYYGGTLRDPIKSEPKLGDFIGSEPNLVSDFGVVYAPDDAGASYSAFKQDNANRAPTLYVGGNDGMLHAFDAENGEELLGYVPGLLLPALPELTDPEVTHRYYVDGSPVVLDAKGPNGRWMSLLASGLGNGGSGLFALDVTNPDNFKADAMDSIALWEYGPEDDQAAFGGKAQIGHIYNKPSVAQLENDRFAVVTGNGYLSESSKATLYILYTDHVGAWADDGQHPDVVRLPPGPGEDDTGEASSETGYSNGMMSVALVDVSGDGRPDHAYGADLDGNLWRFDLSGNQQWRGPEAAIFRAKEGQVITSPLEVAYHPDGGFMIFFGTGSRPQRGLPQSDGTDTFYAVRDHPSSGDSIATLHRDQLAGREVVAGEADTVTYRETTTDSNLLDNGWYLDFVGAERAVTGASIYGDRILFGTVVPGANFCGINDQGYSYDMQAWNGTALLAPTFDVNGDGVLNSEDAPTPEQNGIIGQKSSSPPTGPPTLIRGENDDGTTTCLKVITLEDAGQEGSKTLCEPVGRVSWRILE